jgi:hypothetical protein
VLEGDLVMPARTRSLSPSLVAAQAQASPHLQIVLGLLAITVGAAGFAAMRSRVGKAMLHVGQRDPESFWYRLRDLYSYVPLLFSLFGLVMIAHGIWELT